MFEYSHTKARSNPQHGLGERLVKRKRDRSGNRQLASGVSYFALQSSA